MPVKVRHRGAPSHRGKQQDEKMRLRTLALSVAAAALLAGSASAATFTITDVSASFADNSGVVDVLSPPSLGGVQRPWTTPIVMTTSTGQTFTTYCDDLFHSITIEGGQDLTYTLAPVTTNGIGGKISEATSNIMGQIAHDGLVALEHGNDDASIADQAAIWQLEGYGPVIAVNPIIEGDILKVLATTHNDGSGFAMGLVSSNGTQGQILASPIPEPSTWVLLLSGFVFLGYAARRSMRPTVSV
jgi:PEP-CTERM motif